jgi:hypothetical protein
MYGSFTFNNGVLLRRFWLIQTLTLQKKKENLTYLLYMMYNITSAWVRVDLGSQLT